MAQELQESPPEDKRRMDGRQRKDSSTHFRRQGRAERTGIRPATIQDGAGFHNIGISHTLVMESFRYKA